MSNKKKPTIEVLSLDSVIIDGVNAGDIVSAIDNYPSEYSPGLLQGLRDLFAGYQGKADEAIIEMLKAEHASAITAKDGHIATLEANQTEYIATIADLQSQIEAANNKVISQEEILTRIEALEAK